MMQKYVSRLLAASVVVSVFMVRADTLAPTPWAWWRPDGLAEWSGGTANTRCEDATGNGHTLVVGCNMLPLTVNPLRYAFDVRRHEAFYCHGLSGGVHGYFQCPEMTARTVSLWFRSVGTHTLEGDTSYLVRNLSGLYVCSDKTNGLWRIGFEGTSVTNVTDIVIPTARYEWIHLLVSADSSAEKVTVWCNGQCVADKTGVSIPDCGAGECTIANKKGWGDSPFYGYMDDIRVWDRALSEAEAKAVYADGNVVQLLGHYTMDEIVTDSETGKRFVQNKGSGLPDMEVGTLNYVTNGVVGSGALFFSAGKVTSKNEPYDSWGRIVNQTVNIEGDATLSFWVKRDKTMWTNNGGRLFVFPAGYFSLPNGDTRYEHLGDQLFKIGSVSNATYVSEEWSHLALCFEYEQGQTESGSDATLLRYRVYRNGVLSYVGPLSKNSYSEISTRRLLISGQTMLVGNGGTGTNGDRPIRATIDDLRIYRGRLSPEQVQAIYRGPGRIEAGADFSVTTAEAELTAEFSDYAANPLVGECCGEPTWTVVSTPAGGEGVRILNPKCRHTSVDLPVAGRYVFAVSNEVGGSVSVDSVAVTRLADPAGSASAVTAEVVSKSGLGAVVKATVAEGVRTEWSRASGPGGVWFGHATAAKTVVTFSVAGTYELVCTAKSAGGTTSTTLSVTVSGDDIATQLDTGLGLYCPFSVQESHDKAYLDRKAGEVTLAGKNSADTQYVPASDGVAGGYGFGLSDSEATYLAVTKGTYATQSADTSSYNAISCWLYHDGSVTRDLWKAPICASDVSEFSYLCDGGMANDFCCSINYYGTIGHTRFKGPAGLNFTNRWIHVVAQMCNSAGRDLCEVWVNGEKLSVGKTGYLQPTRANEAYRWLGKTSFQYPTATLDNPPASPARGSFPGRMDELRMYRRKLTETEIRYLYEYPVPSLAHTAADVVVPLETIKMMRRERVAVNADAFVKTVPPGVQAVYEWKVLSGAADGLRFADATVLKPTVVARKAGEYELQLVVRVGDRATYSEPIPVSVKASGAVVFIR